MHAAQEIETLVAREECRNEYALVFSDSAHRAAHILILFLAGSRHAFIRLFLILTDASRAEMRPHGRKNAHSGEDEPATPETRARSDSPTPGLRR